MTTASRIESTDGTAVGGSRRATVCALLFLLMLTCRLYYVERFAVPLPFWDQWDAEADQLIRPMLEGNLVPQNFWRAHNEHRILPTRIMTLAIYGATGEWNNLYEARVNVLLAVLTPCMLFWLMFKDVAFRRWRWAMVPVLLAGAILPFGWENFLVGFQSQFYFLELFAVGAFALAAWRPTSNRAALSVIALSILSILTMASGFLTPLVAAVIYTAVARLHGAHSIRYLVLIVVLIALASIGYGTMPVLVAHSGLRADSASQFIDAATHVLGWPIVGYHWAIVVLWLPGAVAISCMLLLRRMPPVDLLMAGCFAWSALQGLAIAFGRGEGLLAISSRYTDLLIIGMVANAWFAVRLLDRRDVSMWRWPVVVVTGTFFAAFFIGHAVRIPEDIAAMKERHAASLLQTINVTRYLETGDVSALQQPLMQIPYPSPAKLQEFLDSPEIVGALPTSLYPLSERTIKPATPVAH